MGDIVAVVGVKRDADVREAGAAVADQAGYAQHVLVRTGDRQAGGKAVRYQVRRQVAKIVLRVDHKQVQLAFHGDPHAWRECP